MLEALGFFALVEAAGLAAAPLAALVLGRLPGAGLGFAKVLGVLLVGWLAWMAGSIGRRAATGRRRSSARSRVVALAGALAALRLRAAGAAAARRGRSRAGGSRRWRRAPARRAGAARRGPGAAAAVARLGGRVRRRVRGDGAADRLRARRLEHREADGHGDADERDRGVARASRRTTPWMAGETVNYYYLGHLLLALPAHVLGLEPERRLQPRASPALFALSRLGGVHARRDAVGGGARARRARRRRAGRRRAGGGRAVPRARQPRGRARVAATPTTRRGDYDWFGASRVIEDTINEFPVVLVHARRPARARAGDPVHAARARVRAAGRARRPARRPRAGARWPRRSPPGSRSARCTRSTRGRIRSPPGCWSARVVVWMREPGGGGRRAVRRRLDGARAARRASCWCCRSGSSFDPAARGIGGGRRARSLQRAGRATWR